MLCVLVPLSSIQASTPILFDHASNGNNCTTFPPNCTSDSWFQTVGTGSNGILIVELDAGGAPASSVTFGSQSLTQIAGASVDFWSLADPAMGNKMITATYSTAYLTILGGSVSYFNVASTGAVVSNSGSGGSGGSGTMASISVPTTPGDMVVDQLSAATQLGPVVFSPTGPGQVERWDSGPVPVFPVFSARDGGSEQPASGSSVTMSWSLASSNLIQWTLNAVALIPFTAPPIPEYPLGLPILTILIVIAYGVIRRRTIHKHS